MKKIFVIIFVILFSTSCAKNINITEKKELSKKDFFIEIIKYDNLTNDILIKKIGKINSTQNINLNSNVSGKIYSILVKSGDKIKKEDNLVLLEDNIGNYLVNLKKTKNSLERVQIDYDSNKVTLDKQIFDSQINLEKLEKNLVALKKNSQENLKKIRDDLENSKFKSENSKSYLEIKKLDNNIEKQKLDYENKLIADLETINGFKSVLEKDYNSIVLFLDDIIEFSDNILGFTKKNNDKNDKIDNFLGGLDRQQKLSTKKSLGDLISYRESPLFLDLGNEFKQDDILEIELPSYLEIIDNGYRKSRNFLNDMEKTLNNSIESIGILGSEDISSFKGSVNIFENTLQNNFISFVNFSNTLSSFLRTYKKSQESLLKQIELLEEDRDIFEKSMVSSELGAEVSLKTTSVNILDSINNLETQIEIAKNNLENAKKNKKLVLKNLNNAIFKSQIDYNEAFKNYSRLTVKSPINGTIGTVFVDVGQEVNIGNTFLNLVSDNLPEIEISLKKDELDFISKGQEVFLDYKDKTLTGNIHSLSSIADNNLNYKAQVIFSGEIDLIGEIVTISIPITIKNPLIFINFVETIGNGRGIINVLKDGRIDSMEVELGKVYGDKIELKTIVSEDIILNDISNFDDDKFKLVIK